MRDAEGGDAMHLRSLLDFNYPDAGIPLDEVESWIPSYTASRPLP